MTSSIAFSICIPCYNGRKFLPDTLESIRAQTHPNWELIIVEDASPEPSKDIVEEFAASVSQQVRYLSSATNQGIAVSRDLAINKATNPIIAILDQDDLWHLNHLSSLAAAYEAENPDFVFSAFSTFSQATCVSNAFRDSDAIRLPSVEHLRDLRAAWFFRQYRVPPGAISFRRQLLSKTGSWSKGIDDRPLWLPNRNMGEDLNFILKVLHSDATMTCTEQVTFAYRKHAASYTGANHNGTLYHAWYYDRYGRVHGLPVLAQRQFLGYLNRQAGDASKGQAPKIAAWFYFRAWRWHPIRIDRLFQSMRTIFAHTFS